MPLQGQTMYHPGSAGGGYQVVYMDGMPQRGGYIGQPGPMPQMVPQMVPQQQPMQYVVGPDGQLHGLVNMADPMSSFGGGGLPVQQPGMQQAFVTNSDGSGAQWALCGGSAISGGLVGGGGGSSVQMMMMPDGRVVPVEIVGGGGGMMPGGQPQHIVQAMPAQQQQQQYVTMMGPNGQQMLAVMSTPDGGPHTLGPQQQPMVYGGGGGRGTAGHDVDGQLWPSRRRGRADAVRPAAVCLQEGIPKGRNGACKAQAGKGQGQGEECVRRLETAALPSRRALCATRIGRAAQLCKNHRRQGVSSLLLTGCGVRLAFPSPPLSPY